MADRTIEAAEVLNDSGKIEVLSLGRVEIDFGIVKRGKILNKEKLRQAFEKLFATAKPRPIKDKKIIFSLPENQVYIHTFYLKSHDKESRDNLVLKEAKTTIPLEGNDLIFSYRVLKEDLNGVEILLVATDKKIVLDWMSFFDEMGIEVELFDIEDLATFRDIFLNDPEKPVCVVDIGEFTSNINIFDKEGLRYSYAANLAGDYFTKKVAEKLDIEKDEAEAVKIKEGLISKNQAFFNALESAVGSLVKEVDNSIKYFEAKEGRAVPEVILLGSSSKMKGLRSYFQNSTGRSVRRGEAHSLFKNKVPLEYMGAVGCALRGVNSKWEEKDPGIIISKEELKKEKEKKTAGDKAKGGENKIFIGEESPEIQQEKKLKKQKIILLVLFVVAVLSIGTSLWYREIKRGERLSSMGERITYAKKQTFNLKIPIFIGSGNNKTELRGRIIEDIVEFDDDKDNLIEKSGLVVREKIQESEDILPESTIEETAGDGKRLLKIKWIVYSEKSANNIFIDKINKYNEAGISYVLDAIKKIGIEKIKGNEEYYLLGEVTISLNQLIEYEKEAEKILEEPLFSVNESINQ